MGRTLRPARGGRTARASVRAEVDHGVAELLGDPDRSQAWTLLVDGTAQSHVDLDDPTHLEFEYVRRTAHVVDLVADPGSPLRALHLGGGAWTLPRYVAVTRPGSRQRVVEIDGGLVDLVSTWLPADGLDLDVVVGDARAALARAAAASVDLLVLDVFAGARTPAHLTSTEFVADAARVLAPGGTYVANVADGEGLAFARTQFAAAAGVFAHLAALVAPAVLDGRRFGNVVLVGSDRELPLDGLVRAAAADPFPARVLDDARVRAMASTAPSDRAAVPSPVPPSGFFGRP
ncbi:spermidine synthase [Pseudonocardia broussonetiae]|uniref:Fused MFS/spermidine synthase n=1 Tax=Pseudonocardia broussonetiae TaxID=2736640 RepID=A0A6M6JUC9_9PSEU|nr:fused MFS/spermidine synthase [Pseudonocardia broussonetiae]